LRPSVAVILVTDGTVAAKRAAVDAHRFGARDRKAAAKAKRATVRFGRPPKELAGEVDARILDAARKTFLERGFEGASIDEIAEVARSGKATIYARFRDKRALFTEVVRRDILYSDHGVQGRGANRLNNRGLPHKRRQHPAALGFGQRKDRADAAGCSRSAPLP